MVGIAAGTLQAYALLVLMGLGNHITNPSDEFAKAELCNVDTSNKIKIDSVCAPTYVTVPLPEYDDNFQNMVPKHVVVKRCLGECFSQTDKKLQCSPTESGVVKRNVEVVFKHLNQTEYCTNIDVEEHTECVCQCLKEDCPNNAVFDEKSCRCKCSKEERTSCLKNSLKKWDNLKCQCNCKEKKECSTGYIFSQGSCTCTRPMRGSFEVVSQLDTSYSTASHELTATFGFLSVVFFITTVVFICLWRRAENKIRNMTQSQTDKMAYSAINDQESKDL